MQWASDNIKNRMPARFSMGLMTQCQHSNHFPIAPCIVGAWLNPDSYSKVIAPVQEGRARTYFTHVLAI